MDTGHEDATKRALTLHGRDAGAGWGARPTIKVFPGLDQWQGVWFGTTRRWFDSSIPEFYGVPSAPTGALGSSAASRVRPTPSDGSRYAEPEEE